MVRRHLSLIGDSELGSSSAAESVNYPVLDRQDPT